MKTPSATHEGQAQYRTLFRDQLIAHPNFLNADPQEIAQMAALASFWKVHEGRPLFEVGEPVKGFFFLMTGLVRISCYRTDETLQSWGHVGGGNILSAYELYRHDRIHTEDARCLEDSVVAMIPIDDYFSRLLKLNTIADGMLRYMAFIVEDCIQDVLSVRAADKLSLYFKRQLVYFKRGEISDKEIILHRDHLYGEIADMTHLTRETVNRELKKWEKQGKLRLTRTHIIITDPSMIR